MIVLVSDAGPGIADPKAALARGTSGGGTKAGAVGSTGLGLDIVRRVAESTGGDLRIGRSVLGGTEVRIWIGLHGSSPDRGRRGHGRRVTRRFGRRRPKEPRTAAGPGAHPGALH
ncbi:hypothetical protein Smic_26680 [Streptomyces microflavus]|uniref:histidine kinase n=1 Tax=Streptomyces microflavus TaxID=1919 RepID=A0A7J0CNP3_STRMI|nr:hypothetical protein Smic_26680 [Streptomyces microflavus]